MLFIIDALAIIFASICNGITYANDMNCFEPIKEAPVYKDVNPIPPEEPKKASTEPKLTEKKWTSSDSYFYSEKIARERKLRAEKEVIKNATNKWVLDNLDYLLDVYSMADPFIPFDKIGDDVDVTELANILFKDENTESVDVLDNGIRIIRRC